jgi:DNA-directed RNA polymerase specialized sigma24 family protein
MIPVHNLRESELREKATVAILEMLADLPETQRNIFVWNHYCGYQPKQIAEMLRWSSPEVEAALDATNSMLYERTRSLLAGSNMGSPVDAIREA